ncbi:site-specific DNA-methyltransferase [Bacteroides sp.]|uniref:DNA-methyltransferase n=1 Tax=Bacteroides sp. TaxID=29523 RepID=UPI0026279C86|nr:site-specific DNA-methyltransferase [Bacteroides sp.]MDD3037919.1 site-specific DNA-methyltransferase [Bacteroides sp.]
MLELNKIYTTECCAGLKQLADKSVNCCVTSPPYYGLRDYGNPLQIGLEETPEAYIEKLVEVFREVRRVLTDDGTLWVNIGDSYAGSMKGAAGYPDNAMNYKQGTNRGSLGKATLVKQCTGCKPKDLIGIPWMLAFALRADGWYLRQDIIWSKPNPMPESVKDRCTRSHEYIFLLSKSKTYYYDFEVIKQEAVTSVKKRVGKVENVGYKHFNDTNVLSESDPMFRKNTTRDYTYTDKANKRSVWVVPTAACKEAHFAVFPEELIVDCIKAGCPEGGVVLDPFAGTGTTPVVARKFGRNYIAFEISPMSVGIANMRMDKELGMFK